VVVVAELPTAVIVPAHNEEAVIGRTLDTLLRDAGPGEFRVIVVCNGCRDRTAESVRRGFPAVDVIELPQASKTAAINAGLQAARDADVLLLDADIELSTTSARSLVGALAAPGIEAAIGHMRTDVRGSSWAVRAFYRVWAEHPYLRSGKFAAAIALSKQAVRRIGKLPDVIADDTYLRRMIPQERTAVVDDVHFLVRVPKSLLVLIRVRSRIHRGNRELSQVLPAQPHSSRGQALEHLRRVCRQPAKWFDVPCYLMVGVAARLFAMTGNGNWERDLSSRQTVKQP
jgi:glycosyltransferase involved in cell wall biosynthesis